VNNELKLGGLKEITLTCESEVFPSRTISENYSIAMILLPDVNFGRERNEPAKAELLIEQALII
jgi:hypothetical protein